MRSEVFSLISEVFCTPLRLLLVMLAALSAHQDGNGGGGAFAREIQIISGGNGANADGEPIDLLISFRCADKHNDQQRLFGSFSSAGRNYETSGDIVQVFPYRACDMKRKGFDRTLMDHIAVVFFDELEPFITGCVSLDNQVRFVERSGALGLVVGPESRVVAQIDKLERGGIPVVILDDVETKRLRKHLDDASHCGSVVRLALQYVDLRPQYTLRLQVFRPTVLNIGLIILLFLLVVFITGLVFIKIRWRPTTHRDIWLRTLARSAVSKMEIRKFEKPGIQQWSSTSAQRGIRPGGRRFLCLSSKRRYLPVFGSVASVAMSGANQERCSICLEEYKEGQELRVLFCGHEFHPKCVDPWLLNNRRCPLCQYDVVYKEYPKADPPNKSNRASSVPSVECFSQQELPLLPTTVVRPTASPIVSAALYMQIDTAEPSVHPERKPPTNRPTVTDHVCGGAVGFSMEPRMSTLSAAAECPSSVARRETRKRRRRELSAKRISRRYLHHRARSLSAPHRRRHVDGRGSPSARQRPPLLVRENVLQKMDSISGYSSDISSYPEVDAAVDVGDSQFAYFAFSATPESSRSPSLRSEQVDSSSSSRRGSSLVPTATPLNRISFLQQPQMLC